MSAAIGVSLAGAMLACIAVVRLSETSSGSDNSWTFTYWTIFAGCFGGASGFWSCYERWFGHAGLSGWMSALIGAIAVSGLGSVVAGTLILPFYGTMFGPLQLIVMMIESPLLAIIWITMLMSAHTLLVPWRAERDSIFVTGTPVHEN